VGEANFLPGQANNGTVTCELGQFSSDGIHRGTVEVMLRPEQLQLHPSDDGPAEVLEQSFYGHDQVVRLRLNSGTELHSRLLGSAGQFYPGQRMEVKAVSEVMVYNK
jgi:iron(III) transport system ATP-binding protein